MKNNSISKSPSHRRAPSKLAILLATCLAACGGGGGSSAGGGSAGGGGGQGELNQGSYDKKSFDYKDPYAAKFHPLQSKTFRASRRDELAFVASTVTTSEHAIAHDDASGKYGPKSLFGKQLFEAGFSARVSRAGALNEARGDELAYLGSRGTNLEIVTCAADDKGRWTRSGKLEVPGSSLGFRQLELELVDVDDDGIDEFVIAATYARSAGGFVRVYDDAKAGYRLLKNLDVAGSILLQAVGFDANVDGKAELLVFSREQSSARVSVLGGAATDFATQRSWTKVDRYALRLVVGDFDDDPGQEFALVAQSRQIHTSADRALVRTQEFTDKGIRTLESAIVLTNIRGIFDAVAIDTNRDRKHEVAVMGSRYVASRRRFDGILAHWSTKVDAGPRKSRLQTLAWTSYAQQIRMSVCDTNADGREDLAIATLRSVNGSKQLYKHVAWPHVDSKGIFSLRYSFLGSASLSRSAAFATVATGDFDRENLVLRSTGRKWTDLPNPMPIVVLAAPPTKSNIRQNYDGSATEYGTEQSTERSHGVTTGWSASFSTGFEASDLFDTFGVSVKQTLAWSMSKTLTNSRKVTWTKTFGGSYDKDVIIFQGTLYQVYEYEVVNAGDEKLIGSKITLNDPVATKTYKWTVDFYNKSVAPEARIPATVLSYEVGSPKTYMRKTVAQARLRTSLGWLDEGLEVGAVRGGSNSTSVTISDSNTTETSRSFEVTHEAEVKIGGSTIGGSFGLSSESVYGVTVEKGTTYAGEVGDIEDTEDWQDWRYSFGLVVYRQGADAKGRSMKRMLPYHVVNYWVDDLGPAHR